MKIIAALVAVFALLAAPVSLAKPHDTGGRTVTMNGTGGKGGVVFN